MGKRGAPPCDDLIKEKWQDIIDLAAIGCTRDLIARVVLRRTDDIFFDNELAAKAYLEGIDKSHQTIKRKHYEMAMADGSNTWKALEKFTRWYLDRPRKKLGNNIPIPEKFARMWAAYDRGEISDEALKSISSALHAHIDVAKLSELEVMQAQLQSMQDKLNELTNLQGTVTAGRPDIESDVIEC